MSKNKRMIYLWDENVDFYDSLKNKSELINQFIISQRGLVPEEDDKTDEFEALLKKIDGRKEVK